MDLFDFNDEKQHTYAFLTFKITEALFLTNYSYLLLNFQVICVKKKKIYQTPRSKGNCEIICAFQYPNLMVPEIYNSYYNEFDLNFRSFIINISCIGQSK